MTVAVRIVGVLLFLTGAVWFLQGIGVHIGKSFMIGETKWVIIGAVVALIGLIAMIRPPRRRANRP
jgi:hypothetical protein